MIIFSLNGEEKVDGKGDDSGTDEELEELRNLFLLFSFIITSIVIMDILIVVAILRNSKRINQLLALEKSKERIAQKLKEQDDWQWQEERT